MDLDGERRSEPSVADCVKTASNRPEHGCASRKLAPLLTFILVIVRTVQISWRCFWTSGQDRSWPYALLAVGKQGSQNFGLQRFPKVDVLLRIKVDQVTWVVFTWATATCGNGCLLHRFHSYPSRYVVAWEGISSKVPSKALVDQKDEKQISQLRVEWIHITMCRLPAANFIKSRDLGHMMF
jgi:hypothetical protein